MNLQGDYTMPAYDYYCPKCEILIEITHSIKEDPVFECSECHTELIRQVGIGIHISTNGIKPTLEDYREADHHKKVKDPERAIRSRKKAFGSDEVGNPVSEPDPIHIVKRGRTLGGQQKEVDKQEFIKAAAKDDYVVKKAQEALKKT